ncbi:FAD-binding oxidoreductase [Streptomyces chumphonensis]|uniref:nitric oxide dioxygenase n=1 Tax=Streptomyces chumphonensis TaxID=1214925 RepID=A0A927IEP4_9ACTN|nr:globin domain-containing protein [Streptomyces chumphonensis]MBD3934382.1 hemin transporter [Streptomyces chumphonensis]
MLSAQAVPVVRATLPAVSAAIEEIARTFYRRMFDAHPELLRNLFNRGNQANGQQQQALAGSVVAFAGLLLERPDARPDAMLARIAHKHVSLGVTSDQYKIVHRHLLAAVAEVLGDAVTDAVAAAWDEVYWLMANALTAIEAGLYRDAAVAEGDVWRPMEITERRRETPDVVSLRLRPTDGRPAGTFRPGQYVSVQAELPDGARQIRQYSLSSAPEEGDWRIGVKRVRPTRGRGPEGEVSTWLHEHARPGTVLAVSAPFGDLVLPDEATERGGPLLLASAGIGITPMLGILAHLARVGSARRVVVVHADRSPADHAHRAEQRQLVRALPGARLHLWYEAPGPGPSEASTGLADVRGLDLPDGLTAYLCGPPPFLRTVRGHLLERGVRPEDVHYEVFGPDLGPGHPGRANPR